MDTIVPQTRESVKRGCCGQSLSIEEAQKAARAAAYDYWFWGGATNHRYLTEALANLDLIERMTATPAEAIASAMTLSTADLDRRDVHGDDTFESTDADGQPVIVRHEGAASILRSVGIYHEGVTPLRRVDRRNDHA